MSPRLATTVENDPMAGRPTAEPRANATESGAAPQAEARVKDERRAETARTGAPDTTKQAEKPAGLRGLYRAHRTAFFIGAVVLVACIAGGIVWFVHASHFQSTDDAFIDARPVLISPQVTGTIVTVNVSDNQVVKAGDLLVKIDPRDYQAAQDQADAQIRQAQASVKNLEAQIEAQHSQIDQAAKQVTEAQAAFDFARDENTRYQDLVRTGSGTVQRAQQAASDFQSRKAGLDAAVAAKTSAERQIDVLQAQKQSAAAQIDQNKALRDVAAANLTRTELKAPVDGRVAKLSAAVGALASSSQSLMVVVPLDTWVTANFKESQLIDMRPGQAVSVSIDAYGRAFPAHVDSIQPGSGTAFSLLPAENATGNYVKVVQRVPVKITFDQRPDVQVGPGMSVVPTVTVRP